MTSTSDFSLAYSSSTSLDTSGFGIMDCNVIFFETLKLCGCGVREVTTFAMP